MLYMNEKYQPCQEEFKTYLQDKVVERKEDADNSLKKFYKSLLTRFSEEFAHAFGLSGLHEILQNLNS